MEKGDYNIADIYQGGYSSLKPSYGDLFTGYHVPASELGAPTKPDTANQIQQVTQLLNQGIIPIEVGALKPEVFDQIPKQHFKEIRRLAQLSKAKISVHAPIIEPSGIGEQGWSEANRELAEKQLKDVVEKSIEMDKKGGMPITIHSAGIPGTEYKMTSDGKKIQKLIVINQETGKMAPIEEERKYYPGIEQLEKGKIYTPEKELESLNNTEWDNSLSQVIFYKEGADRILSENAIQQVIFYKEGADKILSENAIQIQHLLEDFNKGKINLQDLTPTQQQALGHVKNAETYLENTHQYLNGLFNKAYKYGTQEEKTMLEKASNKFKENLQKNQDPIGQSKAIQELVLDLKKVHPNLYVPIEDFAIKHSSKTFANVAFDAFDKHKNKAPTISIENLFPGMAFAYGKDMNKLIKETKEKFVEKAVSKGYSSSEAKTRCWTFKYCKKTRLQR